MSNRHVLLGGIFFLMVTIFVGVFLLRCTDDWCFVFRWQKVHAVDSFEQCAQLGFPVMESYPRQCAVNGKTYTEDVPPIVPPSLDTIHVSAPASGETLTSPFVVYGEAPGTWYFEASFPVQLLDGNGAVILTTHVTAKSDWMTASLVPFEATLVFGLPITRTGTLVFQKDNPSGLPEHAGSFSVPVHFAQ